MRFLVIGAHPDDIELVCGGTMAKYANFAHKIVIATMTNGDKGPLIIPPKRLAKIRQQEARRAASLLSGQHVWVGFSDGDVFHDRKCPPRTPMVITPTRVG